MNRYATSCNRVCARSFVLLVAATNLVAASSLCQADEFNDVVKPLWNRHCVECHSGDEASGKIDLQAIRDTNALLKSPAVIKEAIDVLDANDMPPEEADPLSGNDRTQLVQSLRKLLRQAADRQPPARVPMRRLNRFQYNNCVQDLFELRRNVFPLSEKLMTRHSPYLQAIESGKMPHDVQVSSETLRPAPGLANVRPFPKDLRAAHGFDNQANQLSLSPLLLDAFLRLSVSIVESPDFNAANVGRWKLFEPPAAEEDEAKVIRERLRSFLRQAFRQELKDDALQRYSRYFESKQKQGLTFTDAMKKTVSAALSSPMFLYRAAEAGDNRDKNDFGLASRLSFLVWNSGPDDQLLDLAQRGELSKPDLLKSQLARMIRDPKVERFLDAFPTQWMQLENILAATPDPAKARLFRLDNSQPASLQMVLEPLLLFDTVFIENRPISQLIAPDFHYRSQFLRRWYASDLRPQPINEEQIKLENERNDALRKMLTAEVQRQRNQVAAIMNPMRGQLLAEKSKNPKTAAVDLKPYSAWEFDGDLKDRVHSLDLVPHGKVAFENGSVVLNKSYLLSKAMPFELKAKSLEVRFQLQNLDQRGGGVMGIQGPGDFFDTIVIGERKPRHWISGSNGFARTLDFPESFPEDRTDEMIHLVMVYQEDGETRLYRDGKPYGKPFRKGAASFPKDKSSVIFGLRHLPATGDRYLQVKIDKARFYNRALSTEEVAATFDGSSYVSDDEIIAALSEEQRTERATLLRAIGEHEKQLEAVPARKDINKLRGDMQRRFDDLIRNQLRDRRFRRAKAEDPRYGGVITNAAMLTMTSGPKRTHPIARGAWIIEVIFNDPPPPPPNDVPPLNEDAADKNLTIREKFAAHRENPDCAGCHQRLDPLGFALENFDITGQWRSQYENGRPVDVSGTLMRKHPFKDVVRFKQTLVEEDKRFARAFSAHLLRYALSRELRPTDSLVVDAIVESTANNRYRLREILEQVVLSDAFSVK